MANAATSQGQLQRAGVTVPIAKRKKKIRKHMASVRESRQLREQVGGGISKDGKKKSRVFLVTIIEEGMGNSKDKNYYSGEALQKGVPLFNGTKAYADHPDMIQEKTLPERSMKDLVGWYSDCFVDSNPETGRSRLRGKLHFFPSAKWLTDMIDTILGEPTAQNLFGISINAIGKTRTVEMNGDMVNYVEEFQKVDSADVVTEPAARGKIDKVLESRRGVKGRSSPHVRASAAKVTTGAMRRVRESALTTGKMKEMADSLVAAYNSDNPDEMKEAMYEVSKELHAGSSISGKGPGQVNEEQYSNINPSGGRDTMAKIRTKTSRRQRFRLSKRRKMRAAAGTGPENKPLPEPSPEDVPSQIEEADVEDVESPGDLGEIDDFGDPKKQVKEAGEEEEILDAEEQAAPGAPPPPAPAPARLTSADGEEEELEEEDEELPEEFAEEDEDLSIPEEGTEEADVEEVPEEFEEEEEGDPAPAEEPAAIGTHAEARRTRTSIRRRKKSKEADAGVAVSKGAKAGAASLPSHAIGDYGEDYGKPSKDTSTSAVGKSYKLKTSIRNQEARRVAIEANRRIGKLEGGVSRLRESNRAKDRIITRYQGIIRFHNTKIAARRLLESAVGHHILPENYASTLMPRLYGMSEKEQVQEIRMSARLLESTQEGVVRNLQESVEGAGGRGTVVSWGAGGGQPDQLAEGLAADGIPMKEDEG